MASPLSGIPAEKRRRVAATLGLFVVLFVAIAAVAATGQHTAAAPAFSAIAAVVAVLLALVAWGVLHSIAVDAAEAALDAAVVATVAQAPRQFCDCGHDHDPGELHITDADATCAHDGSGEACGHDCDTCVLAALRPSPTVTRAERTG